MKVGIVGLPNAGKSTLFNALTKGGAQTGDYPFTTIEPNVAIAAVPDERLERVGETVGSSELVPATISFHDIAGLVKGASEGEGLGNRFLASIRETDAICHVVRCHGLDTGVPHPDGRIDPLADIETIETELVLADYEQAERRLDRVRKGAKSGDAEAIAERDWLERVVEALAAGRPARSVPVPDAAAHGPANLQALTGKPVLYVANVDEGDAEAPEALVAHAAAVGAGVVAVSARIEGELAELDPAEAEEMRESYGVEGSGLARLVRAAYDLLELITFFTAGEGKEAVARPLRRGASAWEAAGTIHTEIQDAFVKAEVIGWMELVECGGYAPARDRGLLRVEGRDYVVADGDVITIKV
jgi:GTP-binding protein YchF